MKKLKRILLILTILVVVFLIYVEVVNRNAKSMTYRQKLLKAVYPAIMWFSNKAGKNDDKLSGNKEPNISFYSLKGTLNNGDTFDFNILKGKKVLLVNTASDCGYTDQYESLQKLSDRYKDKLTVIAFPANDFKEQEKGSDEQIAEFCKLNYGVTFALMKKSVVVKSVGQNPVFKWLTESAQNGWNDKAPSWNFSKYLINENGALVNYFGPAISPTSNEVIKAIE